MTELVKEILLCLFVLSCFGGAAVFFANQNNSNNTRQKIEERYQAQRLADAEEVEDTLNPY